jgi:hypothetical protein
MERQKKAKAVFAALLRSARQTWTAESRSSFDANGKRIMYTQILHADGKISCDCKGWTQYTEAKQRLGPRNCSHLIDLQLIEGWKLRREGTFLYVIDRK